MARIDPIRLLARRWIPWGLLALTVLCLVVRLTVRDTRVWSAFLFYIGPWPMLLAAWPVLGWWLGRKRRIRLLAGAGFAVTLTAWLVRPLPPSLTFTGQPDGPALRVMFWNIGHPKKIPDQVHELMDAHQPQVAVLAEAEKLTKQERDGFLRRHPAYQLLACPGGLVAAVRGAITLQQSVALPNRSNAHRLLVQLTDRPEPWYLILADLGPWPPSPRIARTERIRELAGTGPRTLILGDFNTPNDSAAFDSWRESWNHGLTQAPGTPGPATWPVGLPLLAIDHVWMSRDLFPVQAIKGTPLFFDHAWQIITVQPAAVLPEIK